MKVNVVASKGPVHFTILSASATAAFRDSIGIGFLFPVTLDQEPIYTKGYISDGSKNIDEERPCTHLHLAGLAIAAPKDVIWTDNVDYHAYSNPAETVRIERTNVSYLLYGYAKRVSSVNGPMVLWSSFTKYYRKFPDQPKSADYNRNTWIQVEKYNKNFVRFQLYTERFFQNKWNIHDKWIYFYEFDVPSRKVRNVKEDGTPITGWRYFEETRKSDYTLGPFTKELLPQSKRSYDALNGILDRRYSYPNENSFYGDLVRRCANDAQVIPANSIELVMELRDISQTLRAAYGLTKGKVDAKKIASGWLQYKYGIRLTVMDMKSALKGVAKRIMRTRDEQSRSRAREVYYAKPRDSNNVGTLAIDFNYKINYYVHSEDIRNNLRNWFDSGLFPSLTNAWDLIPLSFVLDWFFKVESYLDAIDANTYWSLYDITSVVYSSKKTFRDVSWVISDPNWTVTGDIVFVNYSRNTSSIVHTPLFFDPSPRNFKNYAELASLVVLFTDD